jgi:hypothetical protein
LRRSYPETAPLLQEMESPVVVAVAVAVAVRRLALAKAIEDPKGGPQGCGPFFIGTRMSRM